VALDQKRKYIQWKYSLHQNRTFLEKKAGCDRRREQFDNALTLKTNKIDAPKKIYDSSLKRYQKEVIEEIEIIFHIYSGRIVQDYQCGLGLFIAEKDGIRFLENPSKTHDAVFSMSSGQPAALIISFTLALNKRYSRTKLLFIDDPVQTLDELNIAGLVELLRNEFRGRQIFISTHEDKMSAYMRYKFEKFGLKTQRMNFKEKLLTAG
jgi:DNA repair protein SbcC/Rad50